MNFSHQLFGKILHLTGCWIYLCCKYLLRTCLKIIADKHRFRNTRAAKESQKLVPTLALDALWDSLENFLGSIVLFHEWAQSPSFIITAIVINIITIIIIIIIIITIIVVVIFNIIIGHVEYAKNSLKRRFLIIQLSRRKENHKNQAKTKWSVFLSCFFLHINMKKNRNLVKNGDYRHFINDYPVGNCMGRVSKDYQVGNYMGRVSNENTRLSRNYPVSCHWSFSLPLENISCCLQSAEKLEKMSVKWMSWVKDFGVFGCFWSKKLKFCMRISSGIESHHTLQNALVFCIPYFLSQFEASYQKIRCYFISSCLST